MKINALFFCSYLVHYFVCLIRKSIKGIQVYFNKLIVIPYYDYKSNANLNIYFTYILHINDKKQVVSLYKTNDIYNKTSVNDSNEIAN